MKRLKYAHHCEIAFDLKQHDFYARRRYVWKGRTFIEQLFNIWNDHTLTKRYFRSNSAIHQEIVRHVNTYWYIIHPFSLVTYVKDRVMLVLWIVASMKDPFLAGFYGELVPHSWRIVYFINHILDLLFLIHFIIECISGYFDFERHEAVLNPKRVFRRYLKTYFFVDILPLLPLIYIYQLTDAYRAILFILKWLRVVRMLRIVSLMRTFKEMYQPVGDQEFYYYVTTLTFLMYFILHLLCCITFRVSETLTLYFGYKNTIYYYSNMINRNKFVQYFLTYRWMISMFTAADAHYRAENGLERILSIATFVIGFWFAITSLAVIRRTYVDFESSTAKYYSLLNELTSYANYYKLSNYLRNRLYKYYEAKCNTLDYNTAAMEITLTPKILGYIKFHDCRFFVSMTNLFKEMSEKVVFELLTKANKEYYVTNDVICLHNEPIYDLYIISFGTVAVYDKNHKELYHYEDGTLFGEYAFISKGNPITVLAIEFCEIYTISFDNLESICERHPELKNYLRNEANRKYRKYLNAINSDKKLNILTDSIVSLFQKPTKL